MSNVVEIDSREEVYAGLSTEQCKEEKDELLAGIEHLRQAVEAGQVKAICWIWMSPDGLTLFTRRSTPHTTTNVELRGLTASLHDWICSRLRA